MWFDPHAKLAEIAGHPPATSATTATTATQTPAAHPVSQKSQVSQGPQPEMTPDELARDLYEERAAIREHDGGQDRAEAEAAAWPEARRAAGITTLDDWRAAADDPHNPDAWKNSPTEGQRT